MKKALALIAALVLSFTINAQTDYYNEVEFSADTLHLYFHGCSPHGEWLSITNHSTESLVINHCEAENFHVECFDEAGRDIVHSGTVILPGKTAEFQVFASPTRAFRDYFGKLVIDTDFGIYTLVLYYETVLGVEENLMPLSLSPNPANSHIAISGGKIESVSVFNALGQLVEVFQAYGNRLTVSTAHYPNGIYFARTANGETKRFVVAH